jgi:hypothetical protein
VDPEFEAEFLGGGTITLSYWNNQLWAKGRQRVVIKSDGDVTLQGGAAAAPNIYSIPHGGTLTLNITGVGNDLVVGDYAILNAAYGEIAALSSIDNNAANAKAFVKDEATKSLLTSTGAGKDGIKWDGVTPLTSDVYISGWKVNPDLLDNVNTVYVENAGISGDVNLTNKKLNVLGALVAENTASITKGTAVIPKLDLNGKSVTVAGFDNTTEITSGASTAELIIPAGAFAPKINVQSGKDIRLGVSITDVNIDNLHGVGTLVIPGNVTTATIAGTGNISFAAPQSLTLGAFDFSAFTGSTTFTGPVTFTDGTTAFDGPVKFSGAVTLDEAVAFNDPATFASLVVNHHTVTFGGKTDISSLTPGPDLGNTLTIEGAGDVVIKSAFSRGEITSLTRNDGSISFPWFSSPASLTEDFNISGDGAVTIATKPALPEDLVNPAVTRDLVYNGTGSLTLAAGANISKDQAIRVNTGTLVVPAGQSVVIGTGYTLPTNGPTLPAGTYSGPFEITDSPGTTFFNSTVVFRDPATLSHGKFNGNTTFANTVTFNDNGVEFVGNVTFNDHVTITDGKRITASGNVTLYAGKEIRTISALVITPLVKATGGNAVLKAGVAAITFVADDVNDTLTIGAAATLSSGELVVSPNALFSLANPLTLASGSKLTLDHDASLAGVGGVIAGHTTITQAWKAGPTASVSFEPNKISGTSAALIGSNLASTISLNPLGAINTNTALEINGVDIQLKDNGKVDAHTGAATAAITLSGGARISGLFGTAALVDGADVVATGKYQFAAPVNLGVVDGFAGANPGNYLYQRVSDSNATLTLQAGNRTLEIDNTTPATANGL